MKDTYAVVDECGLFVPELCSEGWLKLCGLDRTELHSQDMNTFAKAGIQGPEARSEEQSSAAIKRL